MMWTIIFTIYCICFAKGVTISTVQKTSILPYSFPDGLIDPQHHYVSYGYQIIGSEILYLAKRSLHSGNKYKIIRMNLETLSQNVFPNPADEFIEFNIPDNFEALKLLFDESSGLPLYLVSVQAEDGLFSPYSLYLHTIDPVSLKIISSQPLSLPGSGRNLKLVQARSAIIKLQGRHNLYIQLEYLKSGNLSNQDTILIKYNIKLKASLLKIYSDKFCFTSPDFIFTSSPSSSILQVWSKPHEGFQLHDLSNNHLSSINQIQTPTVCLQYIETKHGVIQWRSCYGQGDNTKYRKVGVYGNRIYLVYESKTGIFGTGDQDFVLTIIDLRTGVELLSKVYGSARDDAALDLVVNQLGVYVMANVGNGFKDKDSPDDYSTQNGKDNFALIFMDYDGNIQEIESYDTTDVANDLNGDYPKELIIARKDKQKPLYAFLSYRYSDDIKLKGGFYLTYPADQQALFVTGNSLATCSGVSSNCELCSNSICLKWEDGYKIQNGICKSTWDDYFYHQYDDLSDDTKDIDICLPCHETCKTWSDGTARGCLTWAADKVYDSTYKTCAWDTSTANKYLGLNGACVSAWDFGLAAIKANECYRTWPSDSDNYSSTKGAVASEKSTSFSWYNLDRHLYFEEGVTEVLKSVNVRARYLDQFTFTFWIYINQSSYSTIPILGNTEVFSINLLKDGSNNLALQLSILNVTDNTVSTYNGSYSFTLQEWTYWGISFYKANRFDNFFDINIVTKTESGITSNVEYTNIEMNFDWSSGPQNALDFQYLLVGQSHKNTKAWFSGYLNMLLKFISPHSSAEMLSNSHRSPVKFSSVYEKSLNLALIITNDNTSEYIGKIYDYSSEATIISLSNYTTPPTKTDFLISPLSLCTFYQISQCLSLSTIESPLLYSHKSHLSTHIDLIEDGSFSIQPDDEFAIDWHLEETGEGDSIWNNNTEFMGSIYEYSTWNYWYRRKDTGDYFNLGQFPVYDVVPLVYFEAVPQNKLGESFLVDFDLVYKRFSEGEINELLEISLYDEFIAFSLDWLNIQPTDPKLQRQPDGTFEILDTAHFISAGKYQIWWKAPFIDYDGYMVASDHHWIVTDTPAVSLFTCTTFILNSRFFEFLFEGTIAKDDEFQLFTGLVDCNSGNEIGDAFMNNNPVPESYITIYSWIPETAVEMHLCWRTKTNGVYSNYERVQFSDATAYSLTLTDINATTQALPSILEFSHPYGAVIKPGEDFWFSFANLTAGHPNVVPSNNPHNSSDLGKIDISSDWGDNSNDAYFSQTFKHKKEKPNQGIVSCNKSSEQAGKCFIEGISFDNITEIFILFYSNSFSYKNGTSRFYLFGDHENVEVQYCHKLHYLIDSQIVEESDEHAFNKLSLKIDSSLLYNSNYHLSFKYLYNIFFMTFIYADIELYVDGQVCETPTASINFDSFYKRKIELFNLDLKNWTQGNLMANFIWTLSETRYPESLQIHKNDIKIATIGWGDHWLHWRQDLSNLCKICEAGYFYNSDTNEWTNIWGSNFFVSKKALAYESVDYIQKTWVYQWPLGKYPNKDGIWISCHKSWIKWTDKLPEDWTRWEFSNPFLLGKAWVEEWPDDLYDYNFESYTCDKTNYYDDVIVNSKVECQQTGSLFSRDNLSVEIKLKGVGSTIMTTAGGTLQMTVNNKRGNITVNQFIQVSPVPDPNDILTNLFPLVSSSPNVYLNETKTVDLNPDTISNYPDGTAFVVKAVVQNDWGDKAVSFINFSKDPGPTIGDAAIVCSSTPCKVLEDITITLTGDWYNSIIAEMELFIKIEIKVGSQTEVLVVPELWEETEFTFKLPVLQYEDDANLPVDILITAINNYDNSKTLTKSVAVNNTLPDDFLISDYSTITDFNDLEQLTLFASQIKFLLQPPTNGLYNGVIWRRDRDWNNQGVWVHDGAYCEWNEDYSGIDWSIKSNDLSYLAGLINTAIFNLATIFGRTRMKERSDYESKLNILSYLLVRPDLVKYESIETLPSICEKIRNLDDSPLLSFLPNFYYDYIQIVSHYYACIHYEINVKMRYYNETSFKNNINYKSYSKKLEAIKKDSKSVWLSLEKYLVKISSKVTQANPLIEYETNAGLFKTEYKVANTLNGTIYSINSALNYQIHFPSNLYAGTSLTDLTSPIRLITIDWYVSPMLNSNLDLLSSVVGTLSIHIIDKNREIVEIESKIMTITLPFDHKTGYNTSNIGCSAWSLSLTNNIMSDKLCSATVAPLSASPFINCLNWEVKYLASISTTHLSSLAIIEYTNKTIEVSNYPGIGDKKEEQFEDVPLLEQNGFYLLIALFGAYLSGMIAIKILSKLIET